MTTASQTRRYQPLRRPAATPDDPPLTLADEHALREPGRDPGRGRAGGDRQNRWPARELRRLVGYLRVEVLGQDDDEEMLLVRPPRRLRVPGSRLGRDHARLRAATETLERAAAGESTWSSA